MKFNRPTNHYDERIKQIDEKICELVRERKKIPEEYRKKIKELSDETLEIIALEIFDMKDI
jgi:predicted RNA methylase